MYEPEEYDEELMEKEMEEEEMINLLGGDYDAKKKVTWQAFTDGRIKKMKNNEPQLRAFKTILQAVRQENPKQKLFFLEGI